MLNKCDSYLKYHKPNNEFKKFCIISDKNFKRSGKCRSRGDESGKKIYKFNSLGFRGEEYNPKAKIKIFVSGCSYTFGFGLNWEETWAYHFKELYVKNTKAEKEDVNLLNFAISGHSNDYIVRSLISQSSLDRPDLMIAYFTYPARAEYVNEDGHHNLRAAERTFSDDINSHLSGDYLVHYAEEQGLIDTVKNMLLLQYYCARNGIDLLLSFVEINSLLKNKSKMNFILNQYVDLFDDKCLCGFNLEKIDIAADNLHPGPKSNKKFAERLYRFYKE